MSQGDTLGPDNGGDSVQLYRVPLAPFDLSAPRPIHTCRLRADLQHKVRLSGARSGATTPVQSRYELCNCAAVYPNSPGLSSPENSKGNDVLCHRQLENGGNAQRSVHFHSSSLRRCQ